MKKIKHIEQLKAERQKLLKRRIRLEEKMEHQWNNVKQNNKALVNTVSWGYALISGRWWIKAGKKWFDFFK